MRNDNKEVMEIVMELGIMTMSIMAIAAKAGAVSSDIEEKTLKTLSAMQSRCMTLLALSGEEVKEVLETTTENLHQWKLNMIEEQGMPEELADEIMDGKHGIS